MSGSASMWDACQSVRGPRGRAVRLCTHAPRPGRRRCAPVVIRLSCPRHRRLPAARPNTRHSCSRVARCKVAHRSEARAESHKRGDRIVGRTPAPGHRGCVSRGSGRCVLSRWSGPLRLHAAHWSRGYVCRRIESRHRDRKSTPPVTRPLVDRSRSSRGPRPSKHEHMPHTVDVIALVETTIRHGPSSMRGHHVKLARARMSACARGPRIEAPSIEAPCTGPLYTGTLENRHPENPAP
jgi:hypothetical protein